MPGNVRSRATAWPTWRGRSRRLARRVVSWLPTNVHGHVALGSPPSAWASSNRGESLRELQIAFHNSYWVTASSRAAQGEEAVSSRGSPRLRGPCPVCAPAAASPSPARKSGRMAYAARRSARRRAPRYASTAPRRPAEPRLGRLVVELHELGVPLGDRRSRNRLVRRPRIDVEPPGRRRCGAIFQHLAEPGMTRP